MNFDSSRLGRPDRIIAVSAIALFVFLFFFHWFGFSSSSSVGSVSASASYSGWHTFTDSRWVWLISIVVALAAVAVSAGALELQSPIAPGALVAGLGGLSTVLILYRIVHHPNATTSESIGALRISYSYGIKIGIWLGLIAAAGIAYGGYLRMRSEGISLTAP
jgi:hypothetical protein